MSQAGNENAIWNLETEKITVNLTVMIVCWGLVPQGSASAKDTYGTLKISTIDSKRSMISEYMAVPFAIALDTVSLSSLQQ